MTGRFVGLSTAFSVADAENVGFQLSPSRVLVVEFEDWRERLVRLEFADVVGVLWEEAENVSIDGVGFDRVGVVEGSSWLAEVQRQGEVELGCRHYMLNFNAQGCLHVLGGSMTIES